VDPVYAKEQKQVVVRAAAKPTFVMGRPTMTAAVNRYVTELKRMALALPALVFQIQQLFAQASNIRIRVELRMLAQAPVRREAARLHPLVRVITQRSVPGFLILTVAATLVHAREPILQGHAPQPVAPADLFAAISILRKRQPPAKMDCV